MRPYEVCLIASPALAPEEADKLAEKVQEIITSTGGEVSKVDRWGKRRLAFPIQRQNEGYYFIFTLLGAPPSIAEAKRQISLAPEVIRFMFVRQ
ncbi:MAG: 30S ribosomal protein S6 [bacterium]